LISDVEAATMAGMAGWAWRSLLFRLISVCLFVEGATTGLWIAPRLGMIPTYELVALMFVLARAMMAVLQLTAGSLMWRELHAGLVFAPVVFLTSASLYVLEVGLRLRPSSVAPGARWPLVVGYCLYAAANALIVLRWRDRT
jgi:hypothetical protein